MLCRFDWNLIPIQPNQQQDNNDDTLVEEQSTSSHLLLPPPPVQCTISSSKVVELELWRRGRMHIIGDNDVARDAEEEVTQ